MTEDNSNVRIPRRTVDISSGEQVTHPNGSGWVSRPSWEPSEGRRRQEQIEAARQEAVEAYERNLADQHPHAVRLKALEAQVINLAAQFEHLNKTVSQVLTSGNQ